MNYDASELTFSATDLSTYSACRHATLLDREVARGRRAGPYRSDPTIELLRERGLEHENAYRRLLEERTGKPVLRMNVHGLQTAEQWAEATLKTLGAMKDGHPVLFQAPISAGVWRGYVDFLVRVDHQHGDPPSTLGDFHYKPVDAKLAQQVRGSAVLQLCVYAAILEKLQGKLPTDVVVVSPSRTISSSTTSSPHEHTFSTFEFRAYVAHVRRQMVQFAQHAELTNSYPEPCSHCEICPWWSECDTRRRNDDHLSFVAGITRPQRKHLVQADITTLEALAKVDPPWESRPRKLSADILERLHHQARLQFDARVTGEATYELLPVEPGRGLCRLPEPSAGDIFFDIEADRYPVDGTLHYLLGWVERAPSGEAIYRHGWAHDRASERLAFERFVDRVIERRKRFPDMHVFHFAAFEKTALGQMSIRHLSREDDVDDLLRNQVLVDLMPVVKQGIRAGVESYSIKALEQFYGYSRHTDLRAAANARRLYELHREGDDLDAVRDVMQTVREYNREDCESTLYLRDWVETLREQQLGAGADIPRPQPKLEEAREKRSDWIARVADLRSRLIGDMPADIDSLSALQRNHWTARKLLADMLDWHHRESKPAWWEYFRSIALTPEEALDDSGPIGMLGAEKDCGKVGPRARKHRYEYVFPEQEYSLKKGDNVVFAADGTSDSVIPLGEIVDIDRVRNIVAVERTPRAIPIPPSSLSKTPGSPPAAKLQAALAEIAEVVASTKVASDVSDNEGSRPMASFGAAWALLTRAAPRPLDGSPLQAPNETAAQALCRVGTLLSNTVLPVQGPPGSGKTHSGGDMVVALVQAGKRVGVTATSHKVIANLVKGVHKAAERANSAGQVVRIASGQKPREDIDFIEHPGNADLRKLKEPAIAAKLSSGELNVVAGTAWLWTHEVMRRSVDVLVVDEAGQFSLADALAVSVAADSLVLLGDPQQLGQPVQGSHPEGTDVSALEHLLGGAATVEAGRGLFLDSTWRLPPSVAQFTSDFFYGGRLQAHPDCKQRCLRAGDAAKEYTGAGIFFLPVEHDGNVNHCEEEAEVIVDTIQRLLRDGTTWVDRSGDEKPLESDEILVVAPYNAQVHLLMESLDKAGLDGVRVGTVDKFQGQEAPVVFFSMTTSQPEDAPRGLSFLYSLNRLNVATSRSQAIVLVVASPRLLEAECQTPAQMRLVNGLCGVVAVAEQQHPAART